MYKSQLFCNFQNLSKVKAVKIFRVVVENKGSGVGLTGLPSTGCVTLGTIPTFFASLFPCLQNGGNGVLTLKIF